VRSLQKEYDNAMNIDAGLAAAAAALDDLAAGRLPDPARLVAGVLALDTLRWSGVADRDILDAATGLTTLKTSLKTGGTLDLDEKFLARAAGLADAVRAAMRGPSGPR
jgi:hypothetical protein